MPDQNPPANLYHLRAVVAGISPLIWRRLLPDQASIADLHAILQAAFGWSREHLHHFTVHGTDYGICYDGGPVFRDDAYRVRLASLGLRESERFTYTYKFFADWRLHLRRTRTDDPERVLADLSPKRVRCCPDRRGVVRSPD